ncbi:MAG: sensor histidine kinase [Chloroflexota bacterium]
MGSQSTHNENKRTERRAGGPRNEQPFLDLPLFDDEQNARDKMDAYSGVRRLSDGDLALLQKVEDDLALLADLTRSDVLLYAVSDDLTSAVVVADAKPHTVPAVHKETQRGLRVARASDPVIFRCVSRSAAVQGVTTVSSRGAPIVRAAWPVRSEQGVIGVIAIHTSFLEHERQRRKSVVYRSAVAQMRDMIIAGRLEGGNSISLLGEHDGMLVSNSQGLILYISSVAENLYRKLGYPQSLLHRRIEELRTDESVFFKAMESGICVEEVVQEGEYTLVKRAIPLMPTQRPSWLNDNVLGKFRRLPAQIDGAIIDIQDVTEERQKEQELKIKSTMIQEIHHRVKNNLQTIAALLRLQARRTGSPEVGDMLQQTIHRILSIAVVHEYLSYDESSIVNLREVTQRIINEATQGILDPDKRIRFVMDGGDVLLPAQQATSCALIVNELLQNAVEHGFANRSEGIVRVTVGEDDAAYRLQIADDGEGLAPGFNATRDGSLGLQIVRTLVREDLRGQFELVDGAGVRAIVSFPKLGADGRPRPAGDSSRLPAVNVAGRGEEESENGTN